MGAAQIARTTSGMQMEQTVPIYKSRVTALLTSMQPLKPIQAYDMNQLVALLALFASHTHTVADLRGKDTYGSLPIYTAAGTSVNAVSTGVPGAQKTQFLSVLAGQSVNAAQYNRIRDALEEFRDGHSHYILDTTS